MIKVTQLARGRVGTEILEFLPSKAFAFILLYTLIPWTIVDKIRTKDAFRKAGRDAK